MDRFRRMEIFVAVVEAGQLTRAAQNLHLSKSAVSHALTNLEKYLELQLLTRNNRSLKITDAGQSYYEQCKRIIFDVEAMEDNVRKDSQRLSGLIRLSAPDTFVSYTLVPILAKFMDMHPDIEFEVNLTERHVDLIEERIDVAFRTGQMKDSSLISQTIGEAEMMVCGSPSYFEKHGEPKTHLDLKAHRCLKYTRSPSWKLMKNGRQHTVIPNGHIVTDSGETIREFCIRGQGLAYLPSMLAEFAVKKGKLVQTLTDYEAGTFPVQIVRVSKTRTPTRVLRLWGFVVKELRSRTRDIAEFV